MNEMKTKWYDYFLEKMKTPEQEKQVRDYIVEIELDSDPDIEDLIYYGRKGIVDYTREELFDHFWDMVSGKDDHLLYEEDNEEFLIQIPQAISDATGDHSTLRYLNELKTWVKENN